MNPSGKRGRALKKTAETARKDAPDHAMTVTACVFPGDRVVIVPDAHAAGQVQILAQAVAAILEAGIEPGHLLLMQTAQDAREHGAVLRRHFEDTGLQACFSTHCSDDRRHLAMLGTSATGEPIAINREIADADVLVVVQKKRARESAIFPRFSDSVTIHRLQQAGSKQAVPAESREVLGLLNIAVTIEVD